MLLAMHCAPGAGKQVGHHWTAGNILEFMPVPDLPNVKVFRAGLEQPLLQHGRCLYIMQAGQYATHTSPLMCGSASQELAEWFSHSMPANNSSNFPTSAVDSLSVTARIELFKRISDFFCCPGAAHTLWQLAAAAAVHLSWGQSSPTSAAGGISSDLSFVNVKPLPVSESCGFQHMAAARQALISAANQLELSARGRGGGKGVAAGAAKREDVLHEAAMLHLQAGNMERCCDVLVELQEWETALALVMLTSCWALRSRNKVLHTQCAACDTCSTCLLLILPVEALIKSFHPR